MSNFVEAYYYEGVLFEIMQDSDPTDDECVYYFWERKDVVGARDCSFLPCDTIEEVKEDARREVNGENVITEAQVQEQMEILKRRMQPN